MYRNLYRNLYRNMYRNLYRNLYRNMYRNLYRNLYRNMYRNTSIRVCADMRAHLAVAPGPRIQCRSGKGRTGAPSRGGTGSYGRCPPTCSVAG